MSGSNTNQRGGSCSDLAHCSVDVTMSEAGILEQKKLTVKEAAEVMKRSVTSVRRLIQNGKIPVIRFAGKDLLLERDLEAFLRDRYVTVQTVARTIRRRGISEKLRKSPVLKVG